MGWLLVLRTRNALTVDPVVVNTVSKRTESPEKDSLAEELVITVSFLQENNKLDSRNRTKKKLSFLNGNLYKCFRDKLPCGFKMLCIRSTNAEKSRLV